MRDNRISWLLAVVGIASVLAVPRTAAGGASVDLSTDGWVDDDDLSLLLMNWGCRAGDCLADVTEDGIVNDDDLSRVLAAWNPKPPPEPTYRAVSLLPPGEDWTKAVAINDAGQIVGHSPYAFGVTPEKGFLWQDGNVTDLGAFIPVDINASGLILGHPAGNASRVQIWHDGGITDLSVPGPATAISDSGMVVGSAADSTAYLRQPDGSVTTLAGINEAFDVNNSGQVLGAISRGTDPWGFPLRDPAIWNDGAVRDLAPDLPPTSAPPEEDAFAAGEINNEGQVAGLRRLSWTYRPFLWDDGEVIETHWGGMDAEIALNDSAVVVGWTFGEFFYPHSYVWEDGEVAGLPCIDEPYCPTEPVAINNSGWIVGAADHQAVVWIPVEQGQTVPEPTSLAILAAGVFLIVRKRP